MLMCAGTSHQPSRSPLPDVGRWQLWQGRTCKPHVILTNLIASALGGTDAVKMLLF
jgi:hypothetical protein